MNIGIIGAGGIASKISNTLLQMEGFVTEAIASRDLERAVAFKEAHHFNKAYGSYEELMADPAVDLVYIATPHSEHYRNMLLALKYHKPVLCEKAFTANQKEAKDILGRFEEEKVFLAEAMWTRYLPSRKIIRDLVSANLIGKPYFLQANLFYPNKNHARLTDPTLAGGALLDMGIYPLTFALMAFEEEPSEFSAHCHYTASGVDELTTMRVEFSSGKSALLTTSMDGPSDRNGFIYGSEGYLQIININNPERIDLYDKNHALVQSSRVPPQISGYEYEFLEAKDCLEKGLLEPPSIPHATTLKVMGYLDEIRHQLNVVYPFEK